MCPRAYLLLSLVSPRSITYVAPVHTSVCTISSLDSSLVLARSCTSIAPAPTVSKISCRDSSLDFPRGITSVSPTLTSGSQIPCLDSSNELGDSSVVVPVVSYLSTICTAENNLRLATWNQHGIRTKWYEALNLIQDVMT